MGSVVECLDKSSWCRNEQVYSSEVQGALGDPMDMKLHHIKTHVSLLLA